MQKELFPLQQFYNPLLLKETTIVFASYMGKFRINLVTDEICQNCEGEMQEDSEELGIVPDGFEKKFWDFQ
ncbi:MAG: hypothetical protein HY362_01615 [Candidatus Aenigmarchaeota archaeon]|nr:hypothetical protein [Candidatus Aenigmarchaeota archaeon]